MSEFQKLALLIGVSNCPNTDLDPLDATNRNVERLGQVLALPEQCGFEVMPPLLNPNVQDMQIAIGRLFARTRQKRDLVLLYFAGHGIRDEGELHLTTHITELANDSLTAGTAVPASYIQRVMSQCPAQRQVVILDCCFSGAFQMQPMGTVAIDLETELGGEGRAILTSSTSTQYSFAQENDDFTLYTHYLLEGLTGAAARHGKTEISLVDLHDYTRQKVREAKPTMTPCLFGEKHAHTIILARSPVSDPQLAAELLYRQEVNDCVQRSQGNITNLARRVLKKAQAKHNIASEQATLIEQAVLKPYEDHRRNLAEYAEAYTEAVEDGYPFSEDALYFLQKLRDTYLGLSEADVDPIHAQLTPPTPPTPHSAPPTPHSQLRTPHLSPPDLRSEKGVDYSHLRDLLAEAAQTNSADAWQAADQETFKVMEQALGKDWLRWETTDLLNYPCADLLTMDRLWVYYSNGHFGFSVQKEIYVKSGAKLDGNYPGDKIWETFCNSVGWLVNGSYISYSKVTFNTSSPRGHLPLRCVGGGRVWWSGWGGGLVVSSLASRLVKCSQ